MILVFLPLGDHLIFDIRVKVYIIICNPGIVEKKPKVYILHIDFLVGMKRTSTFKSSNLLLVLLLLVLVLLS